MTVDPTPTIPDAGLWYYKKDDQIIEVRCTHKDVTKSILSRIEVLEQKISLYEEEPTQEEKDELIQEIHDFYTDEDIKAADIAELKKLKELIK